MKKLLLSLFVVSILTSCGLPICPFGIGEKCQSSEEDTKAMRDANKPSPTPNPNAQKVRLSIPKSILALNESIRFTAVNGTVPYTFSIRETGRVLPDGLFQSNVAGTFTLRVTDGRGDIDEFTIQVR